MYTTLMETKPTGRRDRCYGGKGGWAICTACRGRIHQVGCSTKRTKSNDCCRARHEDLVARGFTKGLDDPSVPMMPTDPYYDWVNGPQA